VREKEGLKGKVNNMAETADTAADRIKDDLDEA
jgi:hypothetical protein